MYLSGYGTLLQAIHLIYDNSRSLSEIRFYIYLSFICMWSWFNFDVLTLLDNLCDLLDYINLSFKFITIKIHKLTKKGNCLPLKNKQSMCFGKNK